MDAEERKRLEAAGYRITDAAEFLGLTEEDKAAIAARRRSAADVPPDTLARLRREAAEARAKLAHRPGLEDVERHDAVVVILPLLVEVRMPPSDWIDDSRWSCS